MNIPEAFEAPETPALLIDWERLSLNIREFADLCRREGKRMMPHIKTHKSVAIARLQLEAGAEGLTCSKLSEAEAMLPSGVRKIFLAHSLVSPAKIPRIQRLARSLDELVLAVTSAAQARHLDALLSEAGLQVPVLLALDSGLHREGARGLEQLCEMKTTVDACDRLDYRGIYTHEGFTYSSDPKEIARQAAATADLLREARKAVGGGELWPGCSVTATMMAPEPDLTGLRPGSYVFSDLTLTDLTHVRPWEALALCVAATVVDRPESGIALIDAGSKVFSSDKVPGHPHALPLSRADYSLTKLSEEHGFLTGEGVNKLEIGETVFLVPFHVCPVLNLASHFFAIQSDGTTQPTPIEGRGKTL